MAWDEERKIRSEDTWEQVRREWEAGETGASLAQRYDVGLANLWRRRASEGWRRKRAEDPLPEPVEGWERHGERKLAAFEHRREETRQLAVKLAEAMTGGGDLEGVPLWHVSFVLTWRAERLGAEAAARDRAYMRKYAWADKFWSPEGELYPLWALDPVVLQANREEWRQDAGLPEGKAAWIP